MLESQREYNDIKSSMVHILLYKDFPRKRKKDEPGPQNVLIKHIAYDQHLLVSKNKNKMLVMVTVESGPRHHIRLITIMQRVEAVSPGTKTNDLSPRVKIRMAENSDLDKWANRALPLSVLFVDQRTRSSLPLSHDSSLTRPPLYIYCFTTKEINNVNYDS